MLKIKNLHATVAGKEILKGLNLELKAGEVHAIMGPNGAGKSRARAPWVMFWQAGKVMRSHRVRLPSEVKTCWNWNRKNVPVKVFFWPFNTRLKSQGLTTRISCGRH